MKAYPLNLSRHPAYAPSSPGFAGILFIVSDTLSLAAAFVFATILTHWVRSALFTAAYVDYEYPILPTRGLQVALLGIALFFWTAACGHYTGRRALSTEARELLIGIAVVGLIDGYLQFALKLQPSRLWLAATWLLSFIFIIITRVGLKHMLFRVGVWRCPTVIVGTGRQIDDVAHAVGADPYLGYFVVERLDVERDLDVERRLDALIVAKIARYVLIAFDEKHAGKMLAIARSTEDRFTIPLGLVPNIRGISFSDLELQRFFGHDLIILNNNRRSQRAANVASKRIFDIITAACIVTLLAPILAIVAFLIKLDGGPIIYRSPRVGRDGRIFQALKFRSMVQDADAVLDDMLERDPNLRSEWQQSFKLRRDPRITRVGRFIRKSSLDELPQLFNVLSGDMSLVGPRPLLLNERDVYKGRAFDLYGQVTPGITGMWQISGRNDLEYYRRIELNTWYIKNWSSWLDVIILCKTFFVVVKRAGYHE